MKFTCAMSESNKTVAFFGASGGCGFFALKHAVAAGYSCLALCRSPSKLDAQFPTKPANLVVQAGNAHDVHAVASCLTVPGNTAQLVDAIYFTIGAKLDMTKMTLDDPDVCKKGMAALLDALKRLRDGGAQGRPLIVVGSTTGISEHQRDVPLMFLPMYKLMLDQPHRDKKVMEDAVIKSGESFVLLRPSFLTDGEKPQRKIRVGVEDPQRGVESKAVGYVISREEVGRWVYENLLRGDPSQYMGKAVSITW
ncbi:NAD(P)-binding protein [Auricularia subglabra TFB-10046 SS5]|nr:NAD(P)-binding protein [Auricularia subglabra TFB-10046 SS5]